MINLPIYLSARHYCRPAAHAPLAAQARASAGLKPLTLDPRLTAAAVVQTNDQAARGYMGHDGSDGSTFDQRIRRQGYNLWTGGENVAEGYTTAAAVMDGWMNSPGHRWVLGGNSRFFGELFLRGLVWVGQGCRPSTRLHGPWRQQRANV